MPVAPARPQLPPLNALRAFEAAARLGGFALAADELGVTPGAVSQQIKALEAWAGVPLFQRRAQGVRLTAHGLRVVGQFSAAFDLLGVAVRDLRATAPRRSLTIATLPSIAQLWLAPRLPALRRAVPGVTLSVVALERPPHLGRDLFDLSLFLRPDPGGSNSVVLALDQITPVCAPDVAAHLQDVAGLAQADVLLDDSWVDDWPLWANATGAPLPRGTEGQRYSLYALAVEDAKAGAGVLMGHDCLIAPSLAAGTLVAPFGQSVPTGRALVLEWAGAGVGDVVDALRGLA